VSPRRQGDSLDFDAARRFIASIPEGCWASYGDVAAAAGAPRGGQALGSWLAHNEIDVPPLLYRVIKSDGRVSDGYRSVGWPGLPDTPADVWAQLTREGVSFDSRGRAGQRQRWSEGRARATGGMMPS